jgi:hypothetical protein
MLVCSNRWYSDRFNASFRPLQDEGFFCAPNIPQAELRLAALAAVHFAIAAEAAAKGQPHLRCKCLVGAIRKFHGFSRIGIFPLAFRLITLSILKYAF